MSDTAIVARLEEILKKENPCNIQIVNGKATCRRNTPCCHGCKHLTPKGCTVNSVACKFYFCVTAWEFLKKEVQDEIEQLGAKYKGALFFRHSGDKLVMRPPYVY